MKCNVYISAVYKIKGVGNVVVGSVEQGMISIGDDVVFKPTHTESNPCCGKVVSIELPKDILINCLNDGETAGFVIEGLNEKNMPKVGDYMKKLIH